jgi:DUF1680 family protein
MDVRKVKADERVEANRKRMALERGPLVFCAEWPDNNNGRVLSLMFDKNEPVNAAFALIF